MKKLAVFLGVLLALSCSAPAWADVIASGGSCADVGVTTLTTDKKGIVACLYDNNGHTVWKSMAGGGAPAGTVASSR